MAEHLSVNPQQLSKAGQEFSRIADVATNISREFSDSLRELGNFEGDDETGRKFREQWEPSVLASEDLLTTFAGTMNRTTDGLTKTAALYEHANGLNTQLGAGPIIRR
jgi:hypothetical protein